MFNDNHDNTSMAHRLLRAVTPASQPDSGSSTSSRPSPSQRRGRAGVKNALLSPRTWLLSLLALAITLGPMAPFATPPAEANTGVEIWSATLTTKDISAGGNEDAGCRNADGTSVACSNANVLSDDDFTVRGVTYTIETIRFVNTGDDEGNVHLTFDKTVPSFFNLMTLHRGLEETIPITGAGSNGATVQLQGGTNDAIPAGFSIRMRITIADEREGGYLDTGFGLGGKLAASFSSNSEIYDIAEQSDGKIVAVGFAHNGTNKDFAIARYNPNGSLDGSFGTGGRVLTDFGADDEARAVTIQSDGKIVVAGLASVSGAYDFAVARYTPNGMLDRNFGAILNQHDRSGQKTTNMGATDIAHAVAIDSNNRIVVAGQAANSFGVARYSTAGDLDTNFGGDGKVTVNFGSGADHALDMAILTNGRILLGGYATNDNGTPSNTADDYKDFALAVLLSTGILPADFNSTGKVTTTITRLVGHTPQTRLHNVSAQINSIAITANQRILVGGQGSFEDPTRGTTHVNALAQYKADGTLDDQFGEEFFDSTTKTVKRSGIASRSSLEFVIAINDVAIDGNGNIMAAEETQNKAGVQFMNLYPYASNGLVESYVIGHSELLGEPRAVIIDRNGKLVLAGYASDGDGKAKRNTRFALARFHPGNLKLDTSFGAKGSVTTAFTQEDVAQAVAVDSKGRIVVAGYTKSGSKYNSAIARYRPDGSVDRSFGKAIDARHRTGQVITDFGYGANDRINDMAIDKNGKIVVAGTADEIGSRRDDDIFIARYTEYGEPDTTFGGDGRTATEFGLTGPGFYDEARALAIQENGKIVVVGCADFTPGSSPTWHLGVARFNTDGSLDNTFGTETRNGRVTTQFGTSTNSCANDVAIQPDGKIVVAGYTQTGSGSDAYLDIAVARYNADGSLDETFSGDGKSAEGSSVNERATAVAIQANGEILVAGYREGTPDEFILYTFTADGVHYHPPIPPHGTGGRFHDMTLDPSGRILVVGYASNGSNNDFLLARYHANRVRDASFGENGAGRALADFHGGNDQAQALTIDADGNIVVAGKAGNGYALARYVGQRTKSTDASLSALAVSYSTDGSTFHTAALNQEFRTNWPTYDTEELPEGTTHVRITPTASNIRATIRVDGVIVGSGTSSNDTLARNDQRIDVSLTADDGLTTRSYSITIKIAGAQQLIQPTAPATPQTGVQLTANATTANEGASVNFFIAGIVPQQEIIVVPLIVTNGTAENGDYQVPTKVSIAPSSRRGQGVITLNRDTDNEDETFTVSLGTLPSGQERGNPDSFTITIKDDDRPSVVNLRVRPNPVTEGETARIDVLIDEARTRSLTIPLTVTAGSAESNDYTAPSSVSISPGTKSGSVTLRTHHDPDMDDETLTVALGSNLPALATAGPNSSVQVTIDDDEFESEVWIKRISPNPAREGDTVHVVLGINPAQNKQVTIPVTLTAGTAESGDFSSLSSITIATNQPEAAGSFRVNQDSDMDNETLTVALGNNLPTGITGGSSRAVVVTIEDDERATSPRQQPVPRVKRGDRSLEVTWTIKDDQSPYTGYDVEWRRKEATEWHDAGHTGTERSHTLEGMANGITYQIRVRAKTEGGAGPWSSHMAEGAPVAPPSAPTGFTITAGINNSLDISWTAPSGGVTGYHLEYRKQGATAWQKRNTIGTDQYSEFNSTSITLRKLDGSTTYEVRVRALIELSVGAWSEPAQGTTQ